ncbi:FAD-binding oxidoreductase [Yinghuangia soli]|uniref:FAD-binding oxidoreductase n=1 Tax=Yinghuangia soli TaxID=2908204 RepID=A0AA41PWI0_9ACTN|nr:FAD-binding oxidoreductase [Yinghuangia soli]MCF2527013.1 FAD-binding oxidoreductase [Yinghuangia soli]
MPVDRRSLLRAGAAAALGTATALHVGGQASGAAPTAPHAAPGAASGVAPGVEPAAWQALGRQLSPAARLVRPGDPDYSARATADNQRYAGVRPAGVLACATEGDVRAAVRWCAAHGVPFAPRSGGHNYAGYSTTSGLVISLRAMNQVTPQGNRLHLGGGATNSDVYAARAAGLYFPGGRCPGVGVAGLTLGGGLGFNDRKWGLTCDRMAETRVVLADGTIVRAAADENPDLFWACRGGAGGNFGINTAFVFDAVRVDDRRATVFDLVFPLAAGPAVVEEFQCLLGADRADDLDVRIGFKHTGDGTTAATVLGQRLGAEDDARRVLSGLLKLGPTRAFVEERGFWSAQDHLMEKPGAKDCYASKSLVPSRWLTRDIVARVSEWTRAWQPGPSGATGYVTLFAMGGTTATLRPDETAYPHRAATFVIDIGTHWTPGTAAEDVRALLAQTRAIHHTLRRDLATDAAYVNFPDPDLHGWQHAYYGPNYARLTGIKHRYDPTGLFRYAQAVTR